MRFNRFVLYFDCFSFTGVDIVFSVQVTILLCNSHFIVMSPLFKATSAEVSNL